MTRLQRLFPFLAWPRPSAALLRGEALAGLTVGLMVIPQAVAYAGLAGMPLITGIYAAIWPALVAVLFSASSRLSVGPTALTCLLIHASLSGLAAPGSAEWVQLAMWLALLCGLLQLGLGLLGFGWLLNLVNAPVLMAFTQAAGVLIVTSQLPPLLGLGSWSQLLAHWQEGWSTALPTAGFGLGSLAVLLLARRWSPAFPAVLLLVLATAALSFYLDYPGMGGAVIGSLPQGLPGLAWPSWPGWHGLAPLLLPTLVITLVSFLETASSARVDNAGLSRRWNQDQDLIGQGLGKLTAALSGAFPTSSSFSRSALNLYAGAQTGWSTVFSVAVMLLVLMLLTPVLQYVPHAVLAAIVIVAVIGLLKPAEFVRVWRISPTEAIIAGATFLVTLAVAPQLHWGVLTGMLMSLSHFLYQRMHPRIIEVGLHPDGSLRDRHLWHLPPLHPELYALRMDAALDFATADSFERTILDQLAARPQTRYLAWFALTINRIDATGVEKFAALSHQLRHRGIELHISGLKLPVEAVLRRMGHLPPEIVMYRTDAEALAAISALPQATQPATSRADPPCT